MRILIVGWPSFVDGEATAGDVLAMETVQRALADIPFDVAWSPIFRPDGLNLERADPDHYTHLVFVCGPLHGAQVAALHRRYSRCRRVAVGVSVVDPADPAATGFDAIVPRDGAGFTPRRDLAGAVHLAPVPVVGVVFVPTQGEYGPHGRHGRIEHELTGWLRGRDCARVPLDTRLDTRDWRLCATAAQLAAVMRRLDLVVTTRLHGLVLGLSSGVPVLAVDPVAGGAKVTAQAATWAWPAVITVTESSRPPLLRSRELERHWEWCLFGDGPALARERSRDKSVDSVITDLMTALGLRMKDRVR